MNVLVTGGSGGLGEAIVRRLAARPSTLVHFTFCRNRASAKRIAAECPAATPWHCDFRDPASVSALCQEIPRMDLGGLVNNAYSGAWVGEYFHKTAADQFEAAFEHNIVPTIRITQEAIRCFREQKSGTIVTVLTSALVGAPPLGTSVYTATKATLAQLAKSWAAENIRHRIRSNCVSPSFMETGMTAATDERMVDQIRTGHPLRELLPPMQAAEVVEFLLTGPTHVNGTTVVVNAGAMML
jgi:NAD(P)-dependent dehydrogenase (short-subunit alcohol dehydrogenase family)